MEKLNVNLLIKDARQRLAGKEAIRLAAFHAGITVAAGAIVTLLQYVIAEGIGNTSGLSGMGTRSILQTMQTVLLWANTLLLPFWNLGFVYAAMQWARGNTPKKGDLLTGFRRFGPYLGLTLNRTMLTIAVMIICANISSVFYMMTPAAAKLTEMATATGGDMDAMYQLLDGLTQAQLAELLNSMVPMLVIWAVLSAGLLIPLLYRFRLAEYAILNQRGVRAMPAMIISAALLRRRCWQLVKLDLRLWWYYGLQVLCVLLCYGDLALTYLGITLPIDQEVLYIIFYIMYLAALFAVQTLFRPQVETAYACVYEAFAEMGPAQKKEIPKPQNMPWDEV